MYSNIERAVRSWRAQGMTLLPGVSRDRLAAMESASGVALTEDAAFMYSLCGGMPQNASDRSHFELSSVERALAEAPRFPSGMVPFAEGLISSHLYLLYRLDAASSAVHVDHSYMGKSTQAVSSSMDSAFAALLLSPSSLCLPA